MRVEGKTILLGEAFSSVRGSSKLKVRFRARRRIGYYFYIVGPVVNFSSKAKWDIDDSDHIKQVARHNFITDLRIQFSR